MPLSWIFIQRQAGNPIRNPAICQVAHSKKGLYYQGGEKPVVWVTSDTPTKTNNLNITKELRSCLYSLIRFSATYLLTWLEQ